MLQLHLNMSYTEVRKLPTRYRHWYLNRLVRHFKDRNNPESRSENQSSDNMQNLKKYEDMLKKKFE